MTAITNTLDLQTDGDHHINDMGYLDTDYDLDVEKAGGAENFWHQWGLEQEAWEVERAQDRQGSIDFLYNMVDCQRHAVRQQFVNRITDEMDDYEITELAKEAYELPCPGLKPITEETAERYIRRFGGHLTGCVNEPDSYPTLIDVYGDAIGICL